MTAKRLHRFFFFFLCFECFVNRVVYGIGVTFIEPVYYSSFFSHTKVYGYSNDFERFVEFDSSFISFTMPYDVSTNFLSS